jgi:hypothetical protein
LITFQYFCSFFCYLLHPSVWVLFTRKTENVQTWH